MWRPVLTAPFNRDIEVAIMDDEGLHPVISPCRRVWDGWIKAETGDKVAVRPTHWRNLARIRGPRWIEAKDHKASPYSPQYGEDDWLLLSGRFVVGRVLHDHGAPQPNRFSWSLTGPHSPEALVEPHGTTGDLEAAKAALLASWRRWQEWAGVQDRD